MKTIVLRRRCDTGDSKLRQIVSLRALCRGGFLSNLAAGTGGEGLAGVPPAGAGRGRPMSASADPVVLRHRDLEKIANAALRVGRILMECGGRVSVVREGMTLTAQGLGANVVGERVGYASLTLTVGAGEETITRMIDVGAHAIDKHLEFFRFTDWTS